MALSFFSFQINSNLSDLPCFHVSRELEILEYSCMEMSALNPIMQGNGRKWQ